ncbi:unnamed protein product [Leptidea sinapis]|uniref:Uncharacterized protein n=1 Tax=Leptidea sinapis TaxID=189913 RepID=A0A5E4QB85_9NEOP|nr:unnamed protein product [Leptidea sinapis]
MEFEIAANFSNTIQLSCAIRKQNLFSNEGCLTSSVRQVLTNKYTVIISNNVTGSGEFATTWEQGPGS